MRSNNIFFFLTNLWNESVIFALFVSTEESSISLFPSFLPDSPLPYTSLGSYTDTPTDTPLDTMTQTQAILYIHGIPDKIGDHWIERLLRICGNLVSFHRLKDSKYRSRSSAFAVFADALSLAGALVYLANTSEPLLLPLFGREQSREQNRENRDNAVEAPVDQRAGAPLCVVIDVSLAETIKGIETDAADPQILDDLRTVITQITPAPPLQLSGLISVPTSLEEIINMESDLPTDLPATQRETLQRQIRQFRQDALAQEIQKAQRDTRKFQAEISKRSIPSSQHLLDMESKRAQETLRAFESRQQRWLERERQVSQEHTNFVRKIKEQSTKRDKERLYWAERLKTWDDKVEKEFCEFYRDRSRWYRTRLSVLKQEADADRRDTQQKQDDMRRSQSLTISASSCIDASEAAASTKKRGHGSEDEAGVKKIKLEADEEESTEVEMEGGDVVGRIMTTEERQRIFDDVDGVVPSVEALDNVKAREVVWEWQVKWECLDGVRISFNYDP